jgi:1,4-alpha-glucan branching enzyme
LSTSSTPAPGGRWTAPGATPRQTRSGTFLDVAARLPYLRDLGINAIELLPIQEHQTRFGTGDSGADYFSPASDFVLTPGTEFDRHLTRINRLFAGFGKPGLSAAQLQPGTNQLKCLVDLCHMHGIAAILGLVYTHAGGKSDDASIWFFDRQPNTDPDQSLYFTGRGQAGGEAFAYCNAWVRQFLIDNAVFFLREYRIDGIRYGRVDAIESGGGRRLCQELTETVRSTNPAAIQSI